MTSVQLFAAVDGRRASSMRLLEQKVMVQKGAICQEMIEIRRRPVQGDR
jgi:hypothetical protein